MSGKKIYMKADYYFAIHSSLGKQKKFFDIILYNYFLLETSVFLNLLEKKNTCFSRIQ